MTQVEIKSKPNSNHSFSKMTSISVSAQKRSRSPSKRLHHSINSRRSSPRMTIIIIIIVMASLVICGVLFSVTLVPEDDLKIKLNSYNTGTTKTDNNHSLSRKILNWLPKHHFNTINNEQEASINDDEEEEPDWSNNLPFWTPIDIDDAPDPLVTLCKLNFQQYSSSPHEFAMFRDLEGISNCKGNGKKKEKLSVLLAEIKAKEGTPEGRVLEPTGFIFHESRVGSTLVANNLACDPWSMVFSESGPAASALLHYPAGFDRTQQIKLFRDVVTLMGRSSYHKSLFFKFQSITTSKMDIALEAFPNTSWAFVFRQPVQTMMSHLDPAKGGGSIGSPCLRSMRDPPVEVTQQLTDVLGGYRAAPREAWCAAHLNMLCQFALNAYANYQYKTTFDGQSIPRGLLINYDSLPGIIPKILLPEFFHIQPSNQWIEKMKFDSNFYSKGRGAKKISKFQSDSEDKEERSTQYIQKYSKLILENNYLLLRQNSLQMIQKVSSVLYDQFQLALTNNPEMTAWSFLSSFPEIDNSRNMNHNNRDNPNDRGGSKKSSSSSSSSNRSKSKTIRLHTQKDINNRILDINKKQIGLQQQEEQEEEEGDGNGEGDGDGDGSSSEESNNNIINNNNNNNNNIDSTTDNDKGSDSNKHRHHHHHSNSMTEHTASHSRFPGYEVPYEAWLPFGNTHTSQPFERPHCPEYPQSTYPLTYNMMNITNNWNTDSTELPTYHYDSLCHFDYQNETDLVKAYNYRNAERPFVLYNHPDINQVVINWNDVDYLQFKLGNKQYRTETSLTNHFMYWSGKGTTKFLRGSIGKKWKPPTSVTSITFEKWLENAIKSQNKTMNNRLHEYFRVSSDSGPNQWLFNELSFFKPKKNIFMVDPIEQKGIHCRFGMRSIIAEAHFDGSRNSIVLLGGLRRYILTHPNQCKYMHMLDRDHPSSRHSAVDWSKPDLDQYPNFAKIVGNEVILQPGDVLYLPTYWIHYIISLNVNFQCNTRSGRTAGFDKDIRDCGF